MKNYKMRSGNKSATELTPLVKRLKGIVKAEDKRDYKEIIREEILKKHG